MRLYMLQKGKIIRMARFCSCSSSADKYAGSTLWNTGHAYSDFDCLKQISHAARPIRNAIQTWVVTRCQHGISALVLRRHFAGKPVVALRNVDCFFLKLLFVYCGNIFFFFVLFCSVLLFFWVKAVNGRFFSTRKEKFRISKRPCNVLFIM